jgi:hypothetical protein
VPGSHSILRGDGGPLGIARHAIHEGECRQPVGGVVRSTKLTAQCQRFVHGLGCSVDIPAETRDQGLDPKPRVD